MLVNTSSFGKLGTMIVRQSYTRHGRSVIQLSSKCLASRHYATETSLSEASMVLASIEKKAEGLERNQKILQNQIYAKISERLSSALKLATQSTTAPSDSLQPSNLQVSANGWSRDKHSFDTKQNEQKRLAKLGSSLRVAYDPLETFKDPPTADKLTLPMLMAAQTHLGHATSLWNPRNSSYIFGIRDGIHIISLDATFAHLRRAAKAVKEIARRGGIILFVGTRDKQQDIVVKAAKMAGGYHIFDWWVPGTLTNGQQILERCQLKVVDVQDKELQSQSALLDGPAGYPVLRPDLVVCLNPLENHVCLHECGLYNVPTVGVIDTDADATWVTYPIPANDDSIRSITLIAGVLGHAGAEGQRLRLDEAEAGRATYSTRAVQDSLESLEARSNLQVESKAEGS